MESEPGVSSRHSTKYLSMHSMLRACSQSNTLPNAELLLDPNYAARSPVDTL